MNGFLIKESLKFPLGFTFFKEIGSNSTLTQVTARVHSESVPEESDKVRFFLTDSEFESQGECVIEKQLHDKLPIFILSGKLFQNDRFVIEIQDVFSAQRSMRLSSIYGSFTLPNGTKGLFGGGREK